MSSLPVRRRAASACTRAPPLSPPTCHPPRPPTLCRGSQHATFMHVACACVCPARLWPCLSSIYTRARRHPNSTLDETNLHSKQLCLIQLPACRPPHDTNPSTPTAGLFEAYPPRLHDRVQLNHGRGNFYTTPRHTLLARTPGHGAPTKHRACATSADDAAAAAAVRRGAGLPGGRAGLQRHNPALARHLHLPDGLRRDRQQLHQLPRRRPLRCVRVPAPADDVLHAWGAVTLRRTRRRMRAEAPPCCRTKGGRSRRSARRRWMWCACMRSD